MAADAELLGPAAGGAGEEGECYDGDGEECEDGAGRGVSLESTMLWWSFGGLQERARDEGDCPELQTHSHIQGEEGIHGRDDDHY